jgi:hypothetical protein
MNEYEGNERGVVVSEAGKEKALDEVGIEKIVVYQDDGPFTAIGLRFLIGWLSRSDYRTVILSSIRYIKSAPPKPDETIIILNLGPKNGEEAAEVTKVITAYRDRIIAWYDKKNLNEWPEPLQKFLNHDRLILHLYDVNDPIVVDNKDDVAYP